MSSSDSTFKTKLICTFAFHHIASLRPFNIMFAISTLFVICISGEVNKRIVLFLFYSLSARQLWMDFLLAFDAVNKFAEGALYLTVFFLENKTECAVCGGALSNVFCYLDCFLEAEHIKSNLKG